MINCTLKWNINCLKSNINAEPCEQAPYDGFKCSSLSVSLESHRFYKRALHLNIATGPKAEPFTSFFFFKASLISSPLLPWYLSVRRAFSRFALSSQCLAIRAGHCSSGPRCHSPAAGRLYIPLCSHCTSCCRSSRTKGLTELTMDCHLDLSSLADT